MKKKQNEKFLLVTSETHNKSNIHNVVNTKKNSKLQAKNDKN